MYSTAAIESHSRTLATLHIVVRHHHLTMMTVAAAALSLNYFSFSEANALYWPWESATHTDIPSITARVYSSNIRTLQGGLFSFSFSFYLLFSFCFLSHFPFLHRLGRVLFSFSIGISVSLTGAPLVYQMRTARVVLYSTINGSGCQPPRNTSTNHFYPQPHLTYRTYTSLFFHFGSRISF